MSTPEPPSSASQRPLLIGLAIVSAIVILVFALRTSFEGERRTAVADRADAGPARADGSAPSAATRDGGPPRPTDYPGSSYAAELTQVNRSVEALQGQVETYPQQWMRRQSLAGAFLARAKLTGDHEDYLRANEQIEQAFAIAPENAGPFLSRASVNFSIHRLDRIEPDLERALAAALVPNPTRSGILGMRGDLRFYTGHYQEAKELYEEAFRLQPSPTAAFRYAHHQWRTGHFREADHWLGRAIELIHGAQPRERAWFALQQGLMDLDRGRLDEAMAHYQEADRRVAGWWLIEEHMAEIHALRGEHAEAERRYTDLIERTDNPEFMDALADLLEERAGEGDAARAVELRARARARYEQMLERLPEAAYGHALEHFLADEDPTRALELARRNVALRPYGESKIRLAQAQVRAGQLLEARATIDEVIGSDWRSAELFATASVIHRLTGDEAGAGRHAGAARALHPRAMEEIEWLRPAQPAPQGE